VSGSVFVATKYERSSWRIANAPSLLILKDASAPAFSFVANARSSTYAVVAVSFRSGASPQSFLVRCANTSASSCDAKAFSIRTAITAYRLPVFIVTRQREPTPLRLKLFVLRLIQSQPTTPPGTMPPPPSPAI
jgi:hypothetical protein